MDASRKRPPIRVLIVEDSPVAREFLAYVLSSDPAIQVVGFARNGVEAVEVARKERPDVITMDIHMPIMDGYEATRRIMETVPTPIVIVSGSTGANEVAGTFLALERGALAVVRRPPGLNHAEFEAGSRELIQTVKLMSEIKVVRRIPRAAREAAHFPTPGTAAPGAIIRAIAIGASTGGPPVLQRILSRLPRDLPVPLLIVQHMAAGFIRGFAEWLSGASSFPVHIASPGEVPLPGHGYTPPDGLHLGLDSDARIMLSDLPPENGLRPAVAHLFRSVAQVLGPDAAGVLLTGMGTDGAKELKMMKDRGAITIAQDEASSVVFGMPGEAVKLGAAAYVLPPEGIAALLATLARKRNGDRP
ncbi:MAG: chemotaxis-specific protein-glutamate methyltransferase CheB [candidate division WOR-3 bacterium]|nr:chemotaxis-specific protein-glutamate methyltransferase CheB [candidate division WOR-3 bacterium]